MSTTFKRWGQSELLPRYIFAESIIKHQRVLEIGAVASTEGMSAYYLLLRGARTVVACDGALEATQRAQAKLGAPNLMFRPMVFDGLAPASFDLIAITDLAPFIRAPTFFEQLLRLLTPRGYILGALRNAAGLALSQVMEADAEEPPPSYGELRDILVPRFSSIQIATQAPVLGYQLAFEEGEGLQIDGSLASAGEAAYYIVIAGTEPRTGLDPLWVQLPPEPLAFNGAKLEEAVLRARDWQTRFEEQKGALEKAKAQHEVLEKEVQYQMQQFREAQEALSLFQAEAEATVVEAPANLELSEKISTLNSELSVAQGRANEAEARISEMSAEVQRHEQALREATTDALAAKESVRMEREKREAVETQLKEAIERIAQIQEQATQSQPIVSASHFEVEKAEREAALQKSVAEGLRHDLETLRAEHLHVLSMQNEGAPEAAEKESLVAKLQEQEQAMHLLQSDLATMRAERDAVAFQLQMHSEGAGGEEGGKKREEEEDSLAQAQEMQRLNEVLEEKLHQQSDEIEAMREDLALRSHSVERSKTRIRELESMLANAQTQSKEDSALLGAEYDKLKQENASLRSMLETLRAKIEEQKGAETTHMAETMLASLRKRYAEQEQVLAQMREALERTKNELGVARKQLEKQGAEEEGAEYIEELSDLDEADGKTPARDK